MGVQVPPFAFSYWDRFMELCEYRNDRINDQWIDPISLEPISNLEGYVSLNHYLIKVQDVARASLERGKLYHPITQELNSTEFYEALKKTCNVDREAFQGCLNLKLTAEDRKEIEQKINAFVEEVVRTQFTMVAWRHFGNNYKKHLEENSDRINKVIRQRQFQYSATHTQEKERQFLQKKRISEFERLSGLSFECPK